MGKYNFDEIIDRRNTNSMNVEGWRNYIFGPDYDKEFPIKDDEFIRMWVADMDFAVAPEIVEAIKERADKRIFGYTKLFTDDYYKAFSNWCESRYGWTFPQEELVTSYGVIPILYQLVEDLVREGEKVLLLTPSYGPFKGAAVYNGVQHVESPMVIRDGEFFIDFDDLEKILPKGTVVEKLEADNGDVKLSLKSAWHPTTKNEVADVIVQINKLDYTSNLQLPDLSEEQAIRFMSPSIDAAALETLGDDVYLREVSDDPLYKGKIIEVNSRAELLELITKLANHDDIADYPPELTLETVNEMAINLVQTKYEVTVHIGHDYDVEQRVSEEAGFTGEKAIVINAVNPDDSSAPADGAASEAPAAEEEDM